MLTAADFEVGECPCSFCGRPARVYSRRGSHYLRCAWEDCPQYRDFLPPSMETFYRVVEEGEKKGNDGSEGTRQ